MTDMKVNGLRSSVQEARLASPSAVENRGSATPSQTGRRTQQNFARPDNKEPRSSTASAFGSIVGSPRQFLDATNNDTGSKPRTAMTSQG